MNVSNTSHSLRQIKGNAHSSLENRFQMQIPIRLRRTTRLQEDIRSVVSLEIITCVCAEDAGLRVCEAPVGADVQDAAS